MSRHAQALEPRRLFAAGDLDVTFGTAGAVEHVIGTGDIQLRDGGVTPSGKVLALAGQTLTRFTAGGTVDHSFVGQKTIAGHPRGIDTVQDVVLQPDGRLIVAGLDNATPGKVVVLRLNGAGKLDKSFANGKGVLRLSGAQTMTLESLAMQDNGKVLLVGETNAGPNLGRVQITRVTPGGQVDTAFGHSGVFSSGLGVDLVDAKNQPTQPLMARRASLTADGHIVIAGDHRTFDTGGHVTKVTPFVCRITSRGVLDRTFAGGTGLNGVVEPLASLPGNAQVFLSDVAAGGGFDTTVITTNGPGGAQLYQLTSAGLLDPGFGNGGGITLQTQATDAPVTLARQSDGRLLAAAVNKLYRFDTAGQPDTTFGDGTGIATGTNAGGELRLGPDGSILQASTFTTTLNTGALQGQDQSSLRITRRWREEGPAGLLSVKNISRTPKGVFKFTVQWRDDDAVMVSSLDVYHIRVEGPTDENGSRKALKARLLGITQPGDGTVRTALYRISAPGGTWDKGDNGTWTVRLLSSRVRDINFAAASGRTLGSFVVKLKK
jgi:uncharacterized delta-60 repeat protein